MQKACDLVEIEILAALVGGDEYLLMRLRPDDLAGLSLLARQVAQALLTVNGVGPRVAQAAERLRSGGVVGALDVLDDAAATYPTRPSEDLLCWARDKARQHRLREAIRRVGSLDGRDPGQFMSQAESMLVGAMFAGADGEDAVMTGLEAARRLAMGNQARMIPSGVDIIDRSAGGWRRGGLHLVLGLTGRGKSALLFQAAMAAAEQGYTVYAVSAEMVAEDVVPRLLGGQVSRYADVLGAPITVTRLARRDPEAIAALPQITAGVEDALGRITINAHTWPRLSDMLSHVFRAHTIRPIDVLLVDYLQLISGAENDRSREQEVTAVARALKSLAMRLDIAVVAAAQLLDPPPWSRDIESKSRTPAVRESRGAAHAADMTIELERLEEVSGTRHVHYLLRISKLRHGASEGAEQDLLYDRSSCRFTPKPQSGKDVPQY